MSLALVLKQNLNIIIFYTILTIVVYVFRKKFVVESKFIFLYKTKIGLKFMNYLSRKYRALVKLFGYSGIGFGFAGMIFVLYELIVSAVKLFIKKNTAQGVALVLPGTTIPGLGVLSFSFWIITLFIIALVHEFSHGVVARAHRIKVKSSGLVLFGPIIGAFVEPDEKKLVKEDPVVQYSVFSAGPFSNILLAGLVILILNLLLVPAFSSISQQGGFYFSSVEQNFPAYNASIKPNVVFDYVNNVSIRNANEFINFMYSTRPNETLIFKDVNNKTYSLVTTVNPNDKNRGFIGVVGINTKVIPKNGRNRAFSSLNWLIQLFRFLGVLSLGIGLFNLLPLGIVDGGRMLQALLNDSFRSKKKSNKIWVYVSLFTLIILLIDLIGPFIKGLF